MIPAAHRPARITTLVVAFLFVATWYFYPPEVATRRQQQSLHVDADADKAEAHTAAPLPASPRSKIAKVTLATNALVDSAIHRALDTHRRQNDMHGYNFFVGERQAVSRAIEHDTKHRAAGAWTKPAYLLSIIVAELQKAEEARLEWVFWFDADTVVLNPYTPLELFLPSRSKHELGSICLVIGSNWDGLNSGVFGLRVDPWSVSLLSAVLAYPIYELKRQRQDKFRDQSAFQWLLVDVESSPLARNSPFFARDRWAEVPMRWFNALPFNNAFSKEGKWLISEPMTSSSFDQGTDDVYDDGHPPVVQPWKVMRGDMVVHFAGTSAASRQPGRDVRDSWIGPWTERAEAMLPEWANATTQEMLREETRMFWERIAEKWATARIQAREKFQPAAQRRQQKEV